MKAVETLWIVIALTVCGVVGFGWGGLVGTGLGSMLVLVLFVFRYRGLTCWSWLGLFRRRNYRSEMPDPITVANDRAGGGIRYQDRVAVVALQVFGKSSTPTFFTGAVTAKTKNILDVGTLFEIMRQPLGLDIGSISVVITGARRNCVGDYSRVYDTFIGTPPYAGRRETWLIIRFNALSNAAALQHRNTVGTAAIATAQRIVAGLRENDIRARMATASDITALEYQLGWPETSGQRRGRWRSVRSGSGWLTSYAYDPKDINADVLGQAWSLRADQITQNVTLFPNETACATITVKTAQPPTCVPSVVLRDLPGRQLSAVTNNLCGPFATLHAVKSGPLPEALCLPVGASGVLLGKLGGGDRVMLPLTDAGEFNRVSIRAEDAITKRILIRMAAAGEHITLHTQDVQRWASINMPNITITASARPARGTTVSVIDGSVSPAPRPNTVVEMGDSECVQGRATDIRITQSGHATVVVDTPNDTFEAEVELFRAENRYLRTGLAAMDELTVVQ